MRARLGTLLARVLDARSLPPQPASSRRRAIRHAGNCFHLGEIFDRINEDCFGGKVKASITWGRHSGRRRCRSIRLGSYRKEQNLIRINPALDADFVPEYVVEALVHHEMLHAVIPVRKGSNGRRIVHGRDFRIREQTFHGYRQAKKWTDENIGLLLRQKTCRTPVNGHSVDGHS